MLAEVTALRYVTPLREGGSLPGVMEGDDDGTYVVKFTGAGQGPRTLAAEVICAHLLRALDLPVPDLVTVAIDPALAIGEPDEEVQDLLRASPGRNLGMDFLPGALDLDVRAFPVDPVLAGKILWFDALVANVDRSWRNPNMLSWHGRPYLIYHGATLTFAHHWPGAEAWVAREYDAREHALITSEPQLAEADAGLAPLVTEALVKAAVAEVPAEWLNDPLPLQTFGGLPELRAAYVRQVIGRLDARPRWLPALLESTQR
ncbi:MAG TPA: HipA family kinase [Frankiaceae bacterium]|nr:HipA family kinase [Frankiaceae bacterium]